MSRRATHLREVGCIACEELGQVGAGKEEGWLVNNADLVTALDSLYLAIAHRSLALAVTWGAPYDSPPFKIQLHSPDCGHISAAHWLLFDDLRVLALGTSAGYLLFYSTSAHLIHKQMVHPGRILVLRVRGSEGTFTQESSLQELSVAMPGVIARFDLLDIQNLLQRWLQESDTQFWGQKTKESEHSENSFGVLPYQLWNVSKFGTCADAAITGIMPPPLLELQSRQRYYCAVSIGADAVISAFRLSEDRNRSLVGTILSKVMPATFSTIASFSKLIWRSDQSSLKKQEAVTQSFAKASPLTCLKDNPRKGEKLTLSPSGSLAAITDSLGRILLLDTQALVVVRLWKGYRDACCLFMEMLVGKDAPSTSSAYPEHSKSDYCLCLAIHAPRKGLVEVWRMRFGPRLLSIQCPKGSKILQPIPQFGSPSATSPSTYTPLEVFLLDGDSGRISVLNRTLP